jgi:cytochrome P450
MPVLRPPALHLRDQAAIHWTSFTKIIRQPEENWPEQILSQPLVCGAVGHRTMALVADPDAAKIVLGGGEEKFPRWRIYQQVVGRGVGRQSLSAAAGAQWRRQRRAFSPMFRPEHFARLLPLIDAATARAMAAWRERGEPVRIDAGLEMMQLTLDIIWQALFGARDKPSSPPLVAAAATAMHAAQLHGEINAAALKLTELAEAAQRRGPVCGILPNNPFDTWGADTCAADTSAAETSAAEASAAAADDAPSHGLKRQELYDNARVLMGAGHETTALTLTWALWLVAQDAKTQSRIHDEIDKVVAAGPIEDGHLSRLTFTGEVLNETLRLFPPAFVTVRQTRDPVVLAGKRLPAATVLAVCIYALHRHRDWWEKSDEFLPDRFGSGEPRHPFAFLPFSAGPHTCIGAAFAWKEAIAIFATILRQFQVSTDRTVPVRPRVAITLHPDREVPIILQSRM